MHQGDACGPAAFALGLDVALDATALQTPQGRSCQWESLYWDGGTLMGSTGDVLETLTRLKTALSDVGLSLNPAK